MSATHPLLARLNEAPHDPSMTTHEMLAAVPNWITVMCAASGIAWLIVAYWSTARRASLFLQAAGSLTVAISLWIESVTGLVLGFALTQCAAFYAFGFAFTLRAFFRVRHKAVPAFDHDRQVAMGARLGAAIASSCYIDHRL